MIGEQNTWQNHLKRLDVPGTTGIGVDSVFE
jgi:hypothetical protein